MILYLFHISANFVQVLDNVVKKLNRVGHVRDLASRAAVQTVKSFADNLSTIYVELLSNSSIKCFWDEDPAGRLENINLPTNVEIKP